MAKISPLIAGPFSLIIYFSCSDFGIVLLNSLPILNISFIKSTITIEMYSSGLESVKRNKNKSAVALALKALTETRQLYDKHNIDTQKIDSLITEYKQLK